MAESDKPESGEQANGSKDRAAPASGGGEGARGAGGQDGKGDRKKKPNPLKNPKVQIVGAIVIVVLLVGGVLFWLHARQYQTTDDAFVDTHIVRLAPQVSGQVERVLVDDNVVVKPGDVLVVIDSSTAQTAINQARAQRAEALARLAQSRAQIGVSQAAVRQADKQAAGLTAEAAAASQDASRLRGLQATTPRAVSQQQIDEAVARERSAIAQRDAALDQARGAGAQLQAARTGIQGAQASLQAAEAVISQNALTLSHTRVVAPVAGYVTQKSVAPGAYVQPGQQMMAIVPSAMWVTANFKETQLKNMRVGQAVDLKIDACPVDLDGRVASIQRGAGQAFALLPSENATGNFVKVVQRVPVKITFDQVPRDCPLGPGLSVRPRVKVR